MNVHVSIHGGIAEVCLDHAPLNILSEQVKEEITHTFKRIANDSSVRVIFFHTNGDHFCCGANLKEFPERIQNKTAGDVWLRGHEMLASVIDTPQPTIAYIQGKALGGGAELASAFDIRIFSSKAQVGYPEVLRGVFPGNGGLERLIAIVGHSYAMKLVLTGKPIAAGAALQCGLASEVVSDLEGLRYTEELAQYMANLPGVALQTIKQAVNMYDAAPESFIEAGKDLFYGVHETYDVKEAVSAFIEKRTPHFLHQ
ncbi:enoyl-CoA hydratase/isomerase family protein [Aneurinibacillus sp. Ricciae_BoGa-3]|uniref:enoyl-CoA hydratase/isomerase family protein n=1 Tax=Aneurinibacillus sp. Ricciae_BoGa-3 TaxID=3022697 RepID=UPI002342308B|nr:enoyl-CoA hydratase/isomerase family protein [Aneurinibacillus sp. Ricciae_BoGa-3]WCK56417.1 enoyl-CoA hydratase/isomerase family protein [Aneurinibacillus sp. Ricciae_BoGa-3]